MWRNRGLSIDAYADLCARCDVAAAFSPALVEFYFSRLDERPKIVAKRDRHGSVIAAFPTVYRIVFPSVVHKRLLGRRMERLGDIGQPEALFPVLPEATRLGLNHVSPTTSTLLSGRVRALKGRSLRNMAIAKQRRHKKLTKRSQDFVAAGGKVYFSEDVPSTEFADAYIHLFCRRWNRDAHEMRCVREQILALYDHVHGVLLTVDEQPVAAQLCFRHEGASLYYVDFINSGVVKTDDNTKSYGSVMMLMSLRRAEARAQQLGKQLRYSFGFTYGGNDYKSVWADPEPTFVGF